MSSGVSAEQLRIVHGQAGALVHLLAGGVVDEERAQSELLLADALHGLGRVEAGRYFSPKKSLPLERRVQVDDDEAVVDADGVLGLDVAVDDAVAVQVLEVLHELPQQRAGGREGEPLDW